jgi:hypothetical protein
MNQHLKVQTKTSAEGTHDDIRTDSSIHREVAVRILNRLISRIIANRLSNLHAGTTHQAQPDIVTGPDRRYSHKTNQDNAYRYSIHIKSDALSGAGLIGDSMN